MEPIRIPSQTEQLIALSQATARTLEHFLPKIEEHWRAELGTAPPADENSWKQAIIRAGMWDNRFTDPVYHTINLRTFVYTHYTAIVEALKQQAARQPHDDEGVHWYPARHYKDFNIPDDTLRQAARAGRIRMRKGNGNRNQYCDEDVRRCWPERFNREQA